MEKLAKVSQIHKFGQKNIYNLHLFVINFLKAFELFYIREVFMISLY